MSNKIVLAFDTATKYENICIGTEEAIIDIIGVYAESTHSSFLLKNIDYLLQKNQVRMEDISGIILSSGPGSFTGLRIGFSIAKGLAVSLEVPLVMVPTLKALAYGYLSERNFGDEKVLAVALDARKKEIYSAAFELTQNGAECIIPDAPRVPEIFFEELRRFSSGQKVIGLGDYFCKEEFRDRIPEFVSPAGEKFNFMSSKGAFLLGIEKLKQKDFAPLDIEPLYLRKSEAEINENRARNRR